MSDQATRPPLTPYLRAEERYRDDATYHAMVDVLMAVMAKLEMTPAEVREAAIYACVRFEHLNMNQMQRYVRAGGVVPYRVEMDMRQELDRCEERARALRRWLSGE